VTNGYTLNHAFASTNANTSLVYATGNSGDFSQCIQEVRGTTNLWLYHTDLDARFDGSVVPLYVGYPTNAGGTVP
jgi:hypothetical protein